jgi:hypothetical protein
MHTPHIHIQTQEHAHKASILALTSKLFYPQECERYTFEQV